MFEVEEFGGLEKEGRERQVVGTRMCKRCWRGGTGMSWRGRVSELFERLDDEGLVGVWR